MVLDIAEIALWCYNTPHFFNKEIVMIETIIIGAACLIAGTVAGYLSKRAPKKPFTRCEFLAEMESTNSVSSRNRTHTVRCGLEMFHAGPHLHIVEKSYVNAGQQIWFENKESLDSILKS